MMDITSSAWMSANSDSVIQTVSNYNHYSLTQLICTSLFLSQCIILPILIFGFITKRIQQNNTFILPHLIKYIVPTRRMHKHQDIAVKALGKYHLTFPDRSTFHCMTVSTNRYHQHLM